MLWKISIRSPLMHSTSTVMISTPLRTELQRYNSFLSRLPLTFCLFTYPYFLLLPSSLASNIKYFVISQMHYTKVLQSLCRDFFFKSPRGGSHLSCTFQNAARMSPQTLPYFLFRLHMNLTSIFCPLHHIAFVSAHRLPEFIDPWLYFVQCLGLGVQSLSW